MRIYYRMLMFENTKSRIMSAQSSTAANKSRFVVAVGPAACGKSKALNSLIEENTAKYAMKVRYCEGLRQNHVDTLLKKKKCTTLTVESLLDVDARDTFTTLIKRLAVQKLDGKHVHQETRSFFEVPQPLRQHVGAVLMFRDTNEDERRRVFRYFANEFFAERSQFDDALNALAGYDCLLMDKQNNTVRIYNANRPTDVVLVALAKREAEAKEEEAKEKEAKPQAAENKEEPAKKMGYKRWFWSWLGY